MGERSRIPFLSIARNGVVRIAGVAEPVGQVAEKNQMVHTPRTHRYVRGWTWQPRLGCPEHLIADLGWQPRRGAIIGKLYDLHGPTVRAAYEHRADKAHPTHSPATSPTALAEAPGATSPSAPGMAFRPPE